MTDQLTRILATLKDGKATCDLPKADKRTLNEWLARRLDPKNERKWFTPVRYGNGAPREGVRDYIGSDFTFRENAHWLEVWLESEGCMILSGGGMTTIEGPLINETDVQFTVQHPDHNTALILALAEVVLG